MSRFLLDTNALLFLISRTDRLSLDRMEALRHGVRFVSQVCAIEIAIKFALGKLTLPAPFATHFSRGFEEATQLAAAILLPIEMAHIQALAHLPLHHSDPFDRLMIAQALVENLTVVTRDRSFALYPGLDVYEI